MEPAINLALSVGAFLFSSVGLFIMSYLGFQQKMVEDRYTLRAALTDVLVKLLTSGTTSAPAAPGALPTPQQAQVAYLARQAKFLISGLPKGFVSPHDFTVTISGLADTGFTEEARQLCERSVHDAQPGSEMVQALRTFAAYEFVRGRYDEGREKYKQALQQRLAGDANVNCQAHIWTCMLWATSEAQSGHPQYAKELLDNTAQAYVGQLRDPRIRASQAQSLASFSTQLAQPSAQLPLPSWNTPFYSPPPTL